MIAVGSDRNSLIPAVPKKYFTITFAICTASLLYYTFPSAFRLTTRRSFTFQLNYLPATFIPLAVAQEEAFVIVDLRRNKFDGHLAGTLEDTYDPRLARVTNENRRGSDSSRTQSQSLAKLSIQLQG